MISVRNSTAERRCRVFQNPPVLCQWSFATPFSLWLVCVPIITPSAPHIALFGMTSHIVWSVTMLLWLVLAVVQFFRTVPDLVVCRFVLFLPRFNSFFAWHEIAIPRLTSISSASCTVITIPHHSLSLCYCPHIFTFVSGTDEVFVCFTFCSVFAVVAHHHSLSLSPIVSSMHSRRFNLP